MSFSTKILQYRLSKGLTHQAFADRVGVSRGAIQQWEKGVTAPTRKNQPAVSQLLGITVAELMSLDDQANQGGEVSNSGVRLPKQTATDIDTAVETIAQAIALMSDSERANIASKVGMLAHAHDSAALKRSIVEALTPTAAQAAKAFAKTSKKAA